MPGVSHATAYSLCTPHPHPPPPALTDILKGGAAHRLPFFTAPLSPFLVCQT